MAGIPSSDNLETLFSFELLVEYIRLEKERKVSDELAVGVQLLDFPTLLIYQPQQSSGGVNQQEQQTDYAFNRGKSCFFKMNLNSLHTNLSNTPLYAMILDVKEEIPKLVGTSLVSLAKTMDRIRQDVAEHGLSTPSSHSDRGAVDICNLTGEKIGSIFLSYKLISLGASLLPHITESTRGQQSIMSKDIRDSLPLDCRKVCSPMMDKNKKPSNENTFINDDKQDNDAAMQTEQNQLKEMDNKFEEDLSIFCPPHLFYNNSAEEKHKNEDNRKLLNLDSFAFEDTTSEKETSENIIEGISSLTMDQIHETTSTNQQTSEVTANVLREALRQLPLLNALLVELSQLNGQNPDQPLSIHPNLSWIYRPASTEPSAGHGNAPQKAQTKLLQKTRQGSGPHFKPGPGPASVKGKCKQQEALIKSKSSNKSPQNKLVYGTTKTFNLRLRQISALKVKRHECIDLIQNETQSIMSKGKVKSSVKSGQRKSTVNQNSSLTENVITMMQGITADLASQETVTLKHETLHGKVCEEQDRDSLRISEKTSLFERDLKCIHIPSVDGENVAQNKDKKEHHSESHQPKSSSESDRYREKTESSGSNSPKSIFSDPSREGNEEADYADDFNSLETSDAFSPDPASSPEPSRAKTPKSPVCPSDSEGFQKRAALPVPVKAPCSPQRALRGTRIIRPRTHASALSFSSVDGDKDESASMQTVDSRKQMLESSRVERSSGTESFMSSKGQRLKDTGPLRGFSADSISSFDPQEVEELEDELGSLDFKKEYQHISELVANRLPGYTM